MFCIVTGGAGFIGSHVVDALVAAGDDVLVIDDCSAGTTENLAGHLASGRVAFIGQNLLMTAGNGTWRGGTGSTISLQTLMSGRVP